MLVVLDAIMFAPIFQMVGNVWRFFVSGFRRAGLNLLDDYAILITYTR